MSNFGLRRSRLILVVVAALLLTVVAIASVTAVSAEGGYTKTVTLPAGGWAAFTFNYRAGERVGITVHYTPADGFTNAPGAITLDAYRPNDAYRDSIGSGTQTAPGTLYWELSSPTPTRALDSMVKNGKIDAPATPGKYQVIVHNWDPLGRAVTFNLATSFVTRDTEQQILSSRNGPVLHVVSSGQ